MLRAAPRFTIRCHRDGPPHPSARALLERVCGLDRLEQLTLSGAVPWKVLDGLGIRARSLVIPDTLTFAVFLAGLHKFAERIHVISEDFIPAFGQRVSECADLHTLGMMAMLRRPGRYVPALPKLRDLRLLCVSMVWQLGDILAQNDGLQERLEAVQIGFNTGTEGHVVAAVLTLIDGMPSLRHLGLTGVDSLTRLPRAG